MVLLVTVGVQALKGVSFLVAFIAEEEIVTIFAHPAVLHNNLLAVEAVVGTLFVKAGLHDNLELMLAAVVLTSSVAVMQGAVEETFLA